MHFVFESLKDKNGEEHVCRIRDFIDKDVKQTLKENLTSCMPPYHEIMYEALEALETNNWSSFLRKLDFQFRLRDGKTVYEVRFDAENLKKQIVDYEYELNYFDYPEVIENIIEKAIKRPIKYQVIKRLSDEEWREYAIKELEVLEKSDEIDKAYEKVNREGWDYQPTYSEYDADSTLRQDNFIYRRYLDLFNHDGRKLGMSCISINSVTQKPEFCPETDVYFVNKDEERLQIDPTGKLGKRLVELTKKYLQANENDIQTKFERDVQTLQNALPITVLPNARAIYKGRDNIDDIEEICTLININDVEDLDKEKATKELIKALIIKDLAKYLSDNRDFENFNDSYKYILRQSNLKTVVYITDGRTLWEARTAIPLRKDNLDTLLKTLRNLLKVKEFKNFGYIADFSSLKGSIRFDREFSEYECWCIEDGWKHQPFGK